MASMVAAVRPTRPASSTVSGADQLCQRAVGQDAKALDGVQAGLGDAERAGPGVGTQRLHERGGRGELRRPVTPVEIAARSKLYVIVISLTVSDAVDVCRRYRLNPGRLGHGLSALLVLGVFPYAEAVPTAG